MRGVEIKSLRARVEANVDMSRALGVSERPPVEGIDWHLEVESAAPEDVLAEIKIDSDERCPGAYCISKAALAAFSRCLAAEERAHGIRVSTLTLGSVNTPLWESETVHSTFDRRAMLDAERAAEALLYLAQQPATQVVEDLTLMPAAGAF